MNPSESLAKTLLEASIPGAELHYRATQARGEYDFDLWIDGQLRAAVEVTRSADPEYLALQAAVRTEEPRDRLIAVAGLKRSWWIHPLANANIRRMQREAGSYLLRIENDGLSAFFGPSDSHAHPSVRAIFQDLRVESGAETIWIPDTLTEKHFAIGSPIRSSWTGPRNVTEAVLQEANKADNIRKLTAANCPERHLVVVIDSSNHAAWSSILHGLPLGPSPTLPAPMTHAWAVTSGSTATGPICYHARPDREWERLL